MYKSGELELRRDLLNSEMQFLKSVSFSLMNDALIHISAESDRKIILFQGNPGGAKGNLKNYSYSESYCRIHSTFA